MKRLPLKLLLKNTAFTVLLLLAAVALYQLAAHRPLQRDFTQNAINSLQPSSVQVLTQMPGKIQLTVFTTGQDARKGDMRKLIRNFVALYQRYKPDISLDFIDPVKHPDAVRQYDVRNNGEMVVEYDGRREHLTMLNEQAFTSALLSLAHRKRQMVMYLDGHGERKLDGRANFDLGEFGQRLQQNGFRIGALNLAIAQEVPSNADLVVVTQPQADLLPGELDKLMHYVDNGGNLLWLVDAQPLHGLQQLAEKLGLVLSPGIVIDPDAQEMRAPPTWALAAGYPPHPITRNFNLVTVFPYARALDHEDDTDWHYRTVVEAAPRGWVSRHIPKDGQTPHFDKVRDIPGPATVALALQRSVNGRDQRIVVIGNGNFLSNTYAGNGGNLDLGVNVVNWLTNEDNLITIQPRSARDIAVDLSKRQLSFISIGLVIVLPLLLVLAGGILWWRRRS